MIVRLAAVVFFALFLTGRSTDAATPKPGPAPQGAHANFTSQAPADEYFGPLHMSAIGIRMRIDVLGRRYNARTESDGDLVHDASDVKTALRAWNARYPNDTWAAPTAFHLAQLYQDVQTTDARAQARSAFAYVASAYPNSKFGHLSRLRLAQGFPALHDESPVVASPSPGASAPPEPAGSATAMPAAASPIVPSMSSAPSTLRCFIDHA